MDAKIEAAAIELIDRDLPCRACRYNLRSMRVEGSCPECGLAVRESLVLDALWLADPAWLRHIRRGAWVCMAALVLPVVSISVMPSTVVSLFQQVSSTNPEFWRILADAIMPMSINLMSAIMGVLGLWMTTRAEPVRQNPVEKRLAQRARIAVTVAVSLEMLGTLHAVQYALWGISEESDSEISRAMTYVGVAVQSAAYVLMFVGNVAFWLLVRRMFQRAWAGGRERLCETIIVINGVAVATALIYQGFMIALVAPQTSGPSTMWSWSLFSYWVWRVVLVICGALEFTALIGLLFAAKPGAVPRLARS